MFKGALKKAILIFSNYIFTDSSFSWLHFKNHAFPSGHCYSDDKGKSVFQGYASSSLRFCRKSPPANWRVVFSTKNLHTQTLPFSATKQQRPTRWKDA